MPRKKRGRETGGDASSPPGRRSRSSIKPIRPTPTPPGRKAGPPPHEILARFCPPISFFTPCTSSSFPTPPVAALLSSSTFYPSSHCALPPPSFPTPPHPASDIALSCTSPSALSFTSLHNVLLHPLLLIRHSLMSHFPVLSVLHIFPP